MGLFGKKRPLPPYFRNNEVGRLSSLIRKSVNHARIEAYRKALNDSDMDPEYIWSSMWGMEVLAQKDQAKYNQMDQVVVEHMPEAKPQTTEQDQGLLSLFLYRAMVPLPAHGKVLFPSAKSYDRMMQYLEVIFFPCGRMADDYIRSMGESVDRKPITSEDMLRWMNDPDNKEFL